MGIIGLGGINNGSVKRNKISEFYTTAIEFVDKFKRGGHQKLRNLIGEDLFTTRGKEWFFNAWNVKKLTIKQLDSLIKKMK
jgi:hypothetical protein